MSGKPLQAPQHKFELLSSPRHQCGVPFLALNHVWNTPGITLILSLFHHSLENSRPAPRGPKDAQPRSTFLEEPNQRPSQC